MLPWEPWLAWLEASPLGVFMRTSGPWTYALVNLGHLLAVAALFGAVLILDLRLLGLWRRVPLHAVAAAATPVATTAFPLAAASGVGLLATNATDYQSNPFLAVKFSAIFLALCNVLVTRRTHAWRERGRETPAAHPGRSLRIGGAVSLACWLAAVCAGRLIGYW